MNVKLVRVVGHCSVPTTRLFGILLLRALAVRDLQMTRPRQKKTYEYASDVRRRQSIFFGECGGYFRRRCWGLV
jgi:hypothetical protein